MVLSRKRHQHKADYAIKSTKKAQKSWKNVSLKEKTKILEKAVKIDYEKYADDMAKYMAMEMDKILPETIEEVKELGICCLTDAVEEFKRFDPVAPLIKFVTIEEAVEIANDTEFGLSSAVFTSGLQNSWFFADNLQHGTV